MSSNEKVYRIFKQKLLEYASRNNEVAERASWLSSLIEQAYNHINKTNQWNYDQIEDYNDIQYNDSLSTKALNFVNSIDWQPLKKPNVRIIELCPVEIFNNRFFHVVTIILDLPKEDWAIAEQYRNKLSSNLALGSFIVHPLLSFNIPSLLFFFTSSMIEDGDFESIIQHEVMHAFQHNIKKVKNNKIHYTNITTSSPQNLIEKLKPFKAEDENIKKLLRILYLITPTEKSAWLHQISLELQRSALIAKKLVDMGLFKDINEAIESRYYDNLMLSFNIFEKYVGSNNKQQMLKTITSYLKPYIKNPQKTALKIVTNYFNYKTKVQKIVYQQKQQILDELAN